MWKVYGWKQGGDRWDCCGSDVQVIWLDWTELVVTWSVRKPAGSQNLSNGGFDFNDAGGTWEIVVRGVLFMEKLEDGFMGWLVDLPTRDDDVLDLLIPGGEQGTKGSLIGGGGYHT